VKPQVPAGGGGKYTAVNSTIQELIPARFRGWTDLVINGSFWVEKAVRGVEAKLAQHGTAPGDQKVRTRMRTRPLAFVD
jgi:hypothetical protein